MPPKKKASAKCDEEAFLRFIRSPVLNRHGNQQKPFDPSITFENQAQG